MSRRRLLELLQERCRELDVTLHFRTEAPDIDELVSTHDLVVAADGLNSGVRQRYADTFRPTLDVRDCRYIWLGTDRVFDAFKFYIRQTPYGVMQIHGYPFDATGSTFIVEMTSEVWRRAGFADFADREWSPGESDEKSIALIRELFADVLDGHAVMANNSRWISFTTVRNERWVHAEAGKAGVVILGDAAHTAHFSIGSGTKLAMEDALALAACLHDGLFAERQRNVWLHPKRIGAVHARVAVEVGADLIGRGPERRVLIGTDALDLEGVDARQCEIGRVDLGVREELTQTLHLCLALDPERIVGLDAEDQVDAALQVEPELQDAIGQELRAGDPGARRDDRIDADRAKDDGDGNDGRKRDK